MLEENNDNLALNHNEPDGNPTIAAQNTITIPENELDVIEKNVATIPPHDTEAVFEEDSVKIENLEMQDYQALSMEELLTELENLASNQNLLSVKNHVEAVKIAFVSKYNDYIEEKKEVFEADAANEGQEFHFELPLKSKFDQIYYQYRDKKNVHFKSLQTNLNANLENRLAIVEELKNLLNNQENIANALKKLNDIRERWKNAGAIPKDKYNHVWNNFHFHIENFYDYLHLDREARDIDFKNNLDLKLKIIARCQELVLEEDTNKAFRELQDLHRIWKEEIGPVSKDQRETVWNQFSELTKIMHDKRELIFEKLREEETENLQKKTEIIAQLEVLATEKVATHNLWAAQIVKVEALRNHFFEVGKVPTDVNEATWQKFKAAVKNFNVLKNSFYKDIKKDQNDNLSKKMALIEKSKTLLENCTFDEASITATMPLMKQIQEDWKIVGHVPRKLSEELWTAFRANCNAFFDKAKEQKSIENVDEVASFDKKKAYMETMRGFEMTGDHKTDLDAIKLHIANWKEFGKVPFGRRHIEGKFNKILDALFEKLSLSKKDSEMTRFTNRMEHFSDNNDTRKLEGEKVFLVRKIEEIQSEIFQLENNIQFFANTRNAKKENSIVLEVRKNIEKHKEEMQVLKDKLKQLRQIKQE